MTKQQNPLRLKHKTIIFTLNYNKKVTNREKDREGQRERKTVKKDRQRWTERGTDR